MSILATNLATIAKLRTDLGMSFEDAYAVVWNHQDKNGKLPEVFEKVDYSDSKQSRILRALEAKPGSTMVDLMAATGLTRPVISNALHPLFQSGRARRVKGRGNGASPSRYYPMQVAAE
jgi:hypothetical protein